MYPRTHHIMPPPPPPNLHLRPATPSDLPRMVNILMSAFSHGPWSARLFPPRLRTRPGSADEVDWRIRVTGALLGQPGHRHVVAVQRRQRRQRRGVVGVVSERGAPVSGGAGATGAGAGAGAGDDEVDEVDANRREGDHGYVGDEGESEEEILGWAHWLDAAAVVVAASSSSQAAAATMTTTTTTTSVPPGLDAQAMDEMIRQAEHIESMARKEVCRDREEEAKEAKEAEEAEGEEGEEDGQDGGKQRTKHNAVELHYLQIDPRHQRKGVGRLLVQEGLDHAAQAGQGVWLRSTREGRSLYLAMGFDEVGAGTVFGQTQFAMVKRAVCIQLM